MRKVVLIVQDGWGIAPEGDGNYIAMAKTPYFDSYLKKYPHCENLAAGNAVGLPTGSQGNSEVGHLHMGAGRIVWQMYEKINKEIENGEFFKNKVLLNAIKHAKENGSVLHLLGMCSDEGVHSHLNHLIALLEMAKENAVEKVAIHFIADGRDVPEKSAAEYVKIIEDKAMELGIGKIASIAGRYYSMDRDTNWDRTKKAYDLLTLGKGFKAKDAAEAIEQAYKRGDKTDYYIQPTAIGQFKTVKDKDSIIFFNFRTDRPRQLTEAFISEEFSKFKRENRPKVLFTTMANYNNTFKCPAVFEEEKVKNSLSEVLSKQGLKQLKLAETEKYGHVTYFFNSQIEKPYKGEERILVPSPKVPSYDQKPEMSAYEIAEKGATEIESKKFDFVLINFANCDLVGHSAIKEAIIKCVEVVDECTEKVVEAGLANDYTVIVTADHGSAEDKLYPDGKVKPAHSKNPVNFILISNEEELQKAKLHNGGQKDVSPTILKIMGVKKPKEMTGESLL
ncbi:MAG: 2,3-bisphosphoglycerate-independent phosphoglycerate mutase [archaeon]|jgi:2,3-bisphosphoglycerate-independent phosphoglycerate mutase|nr:2,3-bisphosphoglycerate-independent phosphoglycerate mutase [archaeon]